jgi:hypothetical protein
MYYIGLDVHKKTISYCVKDAGRRGADGYRQDGVDREVGLEADLGSNADER